jgi:hypothetical protein
VTPKAEAEDTRAAVVRRENFMIDIEIMMIGMVMSTCVCMVSGILYLHNEMEMGAFLLLGRRQLQNTYFL